MSVSRDTPATAAFRLAPIVNKLPAVVCAADRVASHIGVAIQPIQHRIGGGELARGWGRRSARHSQSSPARSVRPLPGVAVVGRHRAIRVARRAIRRVERTGGGGATAIQGDRRAAQEIAGEVASVPLTARARRCPAA